MKSTRAGVCAFIWLALSLAGSARSEVYYQNDFEDKCDLAFWASAAKVKVAEIGLTDQDPYQGRRCAKISFEVLSGGGWCYFKLPLDMKIEAGKTYILEAAVKYECSDPNVQVGFGHSWWYMPSGKAPMQGNGPSAGMAREPGKWRLLQGKDLGASFRETAASMELPPDCPGRFDALYVHTQGLRAGDKVTVWVDAVRFRPVNDADLARWAKEKRPVEYTPSAYPKVETACPWGVCGSLEGHGGMLKVPLEIEAAITARTWTEFGFDTSLRAGGIVMAPGDKKSEDYLGQFLDLNQKYNIRCLPSTYLTGYYDRKVSREACEAAIRRVVPRYRNHPALLAWWMIDEPMPAAEDVRDQWVWGKQIFESLDPEHPALGAWCVLESVKMYSQYSQVSLIDCYPLYGTPEKPTGSPTAIAKWLEQSWACGARRIWAVPQAFGETPPWRLPTPQELRLMTWLYLSRGSTGFLYYLYAAAPAWLGGYGHRGLVDLFGTPTEMGEEVKRLADVVPALCPVLLKVRWTPRPDLKLDCETADKKAVLDVGFLTGETYDIAIISNLDVKTPRAGKVVIPQKEGWTLYDLRTLAPATVDAGGAVSLRLEPGDAAVLFSGDAKAFEEAKATILSRRQEIARRQAEAASGVRAPVAEGFDTATAALSSASRGLEVWVLKTWPNEKPPEMLAAIRKDAALMSCVNALKELARDQHLLRYAMITGKTNGLEAAFQDFGTLAAATESGVAAFVENGMPVILDKAKLKRLADAVAEIRP